MGRSRKKNVLSISATNQNKSFTELRNTIIHGIQQTINSFIIQFSELIQDYIQHFCVSVLTVLVFQNGTHKTFDIFHYKETRANFINHTDKFFEQTSAGVIDSESLASCRERLARRTTTNQKRFSDLHVDLLQNFLRSNIANISGNALVSVCLHCQNAGIIKVLPNLYINPCLHKANIQTHTTREKRN